MSRIHSEYNLVIGLGLTCQTAYHLDRLRFRTSASPFDGFVTPFESVARLIDNNFSGFMERESLVNIGSFYNGPIIRDSAYGVKSFHDFRLSVDGKIDQHSFMEFQEKLNRRIDRFLSQIKSEDSILFVVHNGPTEVEEYLPLIKAIGKMRNGRYFHIFACGITPARRVGGLPISFHRFTKISSAAPDERWKGCDANWDSLMKNITLLQK